MKSKVRFDGIDVAAMVQTFKSLAIGRRVINIYNAPHNNNIFIFKLDKKSSSSNQPSSGVKRSDEPENGGTDTSNLLLLLESGVRFHTSNQKYDNPGMPSQFCVKLRKHLRGLRLVDIAQLGTMDRVVHFVFGSGESQRHSLMLELYARGNIILTNNNYSILSLLRSHEYSNTTKTGKDRKNVNGENGIASSDIGNETEKNEEIIKVKVGYAYPVTYATTMTTTGSNGDNPDDTTIKNSGETTDNDILLTAPDPLQWFLYHQQQTESKLQIADYNKSKKKGVGDKKKKKNNTTSQSAWKMLLMESSSGVSHYGPSLIEHCLRCANLWGQGNGQGNNVNSVVSGKTNNVNEVTTNKYPHELTTNEEWKALQSILHVEGNRILNDIQNTVSKGYILYVAKNNPKVVSSSLDGDAPNSIFADKILLEFQPHLLKQHELMSRLEYNTFDVAVDTFFSHLDLQKVILRADQQQAQAEQRLEKVRLDQQNRFATLITQQESLQEDAQLVEIHADMVEKALQVVNSALDSGMDWEQLEDLVDIEKHQNHNPVAILIHKLDLENDQIVLRLVREDAHFSQCEENYDENNGNNKFRFRNVTISLSETAHGNAKALFAKYRSSKEKSKKTIEANAKALEAAEETAKRQMLEAQNKRSHIALHAKRKALWFEKFNWFITTDNYLVLGGRDAQQNEQLVKRYLRPGDAYLHADVHGAASCILRAKRQRDTKTGKTISIPLSSQALREAGNFTICRSSAWSSRMVTSSFWVEAHQVSKTAPTGEYLSVGSFMIRGRKTFLPPTPLEMGLAVLFRLGDEDSYHRHKDERRDFALIQQEDENEESYDNDTNRSIIEHNLKKSIGKKLEKESTEAIKILNDDRKADEIIQNEFLNETCDARVQKENSEKNEQYENNETGTVTKDTKSAPKKKGLSVKERKLIKKYGSLEAACEAEEERNILERKQECMKSPQEVSAVSKKQTNHKRGKRSKLKRMAKKYADQDDEDRELALIALHAGEKSKKKDAKNTNQVSEKGKEAAAETIAILKKDPTAVVSQLPQKVQDSLGKCVTIVNSDGIEIVRWDKFDADVLEQLKAFDLEAQMIAASHRLLSLKESCRIDNFSASLAGIIRTINRYGHEGLGNGLEKSDGKRRNKAEKIAEEESWKNKLAEEGIVDEINEGGDVVDDTAELCKLTGKPVNEDLVLFAVPVCAPYQSLSKYSYRVKLTPGNMKRGKASRQCIEMFLRDKSRSTGSDHSRDLIKKVADNEWVQAICGDVKISAAGASKQLQKSKAKAKASKHNKKKK